MGTESSNGTTACLEDILITHELAQRPASCPDFAREKQALLDLARHMARQPQQMIPRLISLANELCQGRSAGVSLLDAERTSFRWYGVEGSLAEMEGAVIARHESVGALCLDAGGPILLSHPERYFAWMARYKQPVPEVLMVPLGEDEETPRGVLWVLGEKAGHFDVAHVGILTELSAFAAAALRMIETEKRLNVALVQQQIIASEMSHRVKNLFTVASSIVRLSMRGPGSKEELAEKLTGRLTALAEANALVRHRFDEIPCERADFGEVLARILRPHGEGRAQLSGPSVSVSERAINDIALVFHELATNAAKYGALSAEQGAVAIEWSVEEDDLRLLWREAGGPVTKPPSRRGYGSRLVTATIGSCGGQIDYDWRAEGPVAHLRLPLCALDR
jgi:two-component sensor histidine kinase